MSKRIDYTTSVDGSTTDAKNTIDQLATERSNGNITDFSVEFRADAGAIAIHVWHDVSTVSDLPTGYDSVDKALSNLPVSLPAAADNAPVHDR